MWKKQKVTVKLSVSVGDHATLKARKVQCTEVVTDGVWNPTCHGRGRTGSYVSSGSHVQ